MINTTISTKNPKSHLIWVQFSYRPLYIIQNNFRLAVVKKQKYKNFHKWRGGNKFMGLLIIFEVKTLKKVLNDVRMEHFVL